MINFYPTYPSKIKGNKKGLPYGNPSEYYVKKQKTELPHD